MSLRDEVKKEIENYETRSVALDLLMQKIAKKSHNVFEDKRCFVNKKKVFPGD